MDPEIGARFSVRRKRALSLMGWWAVPAADEGPETLLPPAISDALEVYSEGKGVMSLVPTMGEGAWMSRSTMMGFESLCDKFSEGSCSAVPAHVISERRSVAYSYRDVLKESALFPWPLSPVISMTRFRRRRRRTPYQNAASTKHSTNMKTPTAPPTIAATGTEPLGDADLGWALPPEVFVVLYSIQSRW